MWLSRRGAGTTKWDRIGGLAGVLENGHGNLGPAQGISKTLASVKKDMGLLRDQKLQGIGKTDASVCYLALDQGRGDATTPSKIPSAPARRRRPPPLGKAKYVPPPRILLLQLRLTANHLLCSLVIIIMMRYYCMGSDAMQFISIEELPTILPFIVVGLSLL